MASLHVSLNQTALCVRTENLLLGILFLAMVNNCSLNSSREISGSQQPSSSLALLEKEGQSALRSFQLGRADEVSMEQWKKKCDKSEDVGLYKCSGCGVAEGSDEDLKMNEAWINAADRIVTEMCSEMHGVYDDDYFLCKECSD